MRDFRRTRPSPATLVAMLALILALGGTAIAAINLGKGDVKRKHLAKNSVTSKKIKDGAVRAAKLGGDVRAYAAVNLDEELVAGRSKGVISMDVPVEGMYCFELEFKADVAVASVTTGAAVDNFAQGAVPAAPECSSGAEAAVATVDIQPTQLTENAPFFVIFN